ncbi:MAG TPA: metallophosphoesterase [Solirubrobacterales bacterium]|nr:metallophosphoesterase [Solirubrobacterales bacterium]
MLAAQTTGESALRPQILHISDLHLGPVAAAQYLAHHRVGVTSDRRAQRDVVKVTIEALASSGQLAEMDAVVVSGDLTNRDQPDGYEFFGELARILLQVLDPSRILVVPGNHDVDKEVEVGDPARYQHFFAATRDLGLVTPLIDGIDFNADGALTEEAALAPHLVAGEGFLILPINSSHFCWVKESVDSRHRSGLSPETAEILDEATQELRTFDMPRVSDPQMLALRHLLDQSGPFPANTLHLAAIHHQLLPVDPREEMKPFEGITNLGALREFLADIDIEVVLHGHKHAAALYWDRVAVSPRLQDPAHNILVCAAPARFEPGLPMARVLTLGPSPLASEVAVDEIRAGTPFGAAPDRRPLALARLWEFGADDEGDGEVICAEDFDAVYARVRSRFETVPADAALRYLICEITRPRDLGRPPRDYPEPHPGWFKDLVEWWQFDEPHFDKEVTFNHGDRIHRRWGEKTQAAARLLSKAIPNDTATTRASIFLVDPQLEGSPEGTDEFPSFVSVQLQLVERVGAYELDCTGSFRKQEMHYWWPINVAELGRIQDEVLKLMTSSERPLRAGRIRTVTAYAIAKSVIPAVAHAAIDRAVDREPLELWRLAFGLLAPDQVLDPAALRNRWEHYLEDLRPRTNEGMPALSSRGLKEVLNFAEVGSRAPGAAELLAALQELVNFYVVVDPNPTDPTEILSTLNERLAAFEAALDRQYGPAKGP